MAKITIESLQAELEAKNEVIATQEAKLAEQAEVITELNKEVDVLSKQKTVAKAVVKYNGNSYEVSAPRFQHKGEIKTTADLESDKELVAELIEQGSGVLELIEK